MKDGIDIRNKIDYLKASISALKEERDMLYRIGWLQKTNTVKEILEINRILSEMDQAKQDYYTNKLKIIRVEDELHEITASTQLTIF